jgi:voltage-gated potassium channel
VKLILALVQDREMIVLGEGVDLFVVRVPKSLAGKTLAQSQIAAKVGLNVIAIQKEDQLLANPPAHQRLERDAELLVIGTPEQRLAFTRSFA